METIQDLFDKIEEGILISPKKLENISENGCNYRDNCSLCELHPMCKLFFTSMTDDSKQVSIKSAKMIKLLSEKLETFSIHR